LKRVYIEQLFINYAKNENLDGKLFFFIETSGDFLENTISGTISEHDFRQNSQGVPRTWEFFLKSYSEIVPEIV